jgi:hypothetical protein
MLFRIAQYHTGPPIKKKNSFNHFHNDPTVLFEQIYILPLFVHYGFARDTKGDLNFF